jgi:hypothetical protein
MILRPLCEAILSGENEISPAAEKQLGCADLHPIVSYQPYPYPYGLP